MKKKVVAFVPIRLNSKRIVGKNLKPLGGRPLMVYIFETLLKVHEIDEVYAYCSNEDVKEYLPPGVIFLKRDENLDRDETVGKEIYDAFCKTIDADIYILAHTTSPFIKPQSIKTALDNVIAETHDSAFNVQQIKTFAWYQGKPLNYSLLEIPRTQDIEPVFAETSAFFIFEKHVWTQLRRRIGEKPFMQIADSIEGIDIDNPDDFELAEKVFTNV